MSKATTVAGIPSDNGIDSKRLSFYTGLALDSSNGIYAADYENNRVQKWSMDARTAKTVAGQIGGASNSTAATLNFPTKVVVDPSGNIYVTDGNNHRVQLWYVGASSGVTVAGTGNKLK